MIIQTVDILGRSYLLNRKRIFNARFFMLLVSLVINYKNEALKKVRSKFIILVPLKKYMLAVWFFPSILAI